MSGTTAFRVVPNERNPDSRQRSDAGLPGRA